MLASCALSAAPVAAQSFSGPASVVDGDSLEMTGMAIRLWGMDAPEAMQTCERAGVAWECGREAMRTLAELVDGKGLVCEARGEDEYGRTVALCSVGSLDLSSLLVGAGLAVALPRITDAYVEDELRARSLKLGIWNSTFTDPAEFRTAHPELAPTPVVRAQTFARQDVPTGSPSTSGSVYFRNCNEARAAGRAPMRRGQPGYRPGLDGDNDGIACEPIRR